MPEGGRAGAKERPAPRRRSRHALLRAIPLTTLAALGAAPLVFVAGHGALVGPRLDVSTLGHSVAFALAGAFLACFFGGAAGLIVGVLDFHRGEADAKAGCIEWTATLDGSGRVYQL